MKLIYPFYSKRLITFLIIDFVFILLLILSMIFLPRNLLYLVCLGVVLLYWKIWKWIKPYGRGLEGEADISDELRKLPDEYKVFTNIVLGNGGNLDKVVICPSGVWALEVKNWSGKIDAKNPYLSKALTQSRGSAVRLSEFINEKLKEKIYVQPVLVSSNEKASIKFGFNKVEDVYVVGKKWLNDLLVMHTSGILTPDHKVELENILASLPNSIPLK